MPVKILFSSSCSDIFSFNDIHVFPPQKYDRLLMEQGEIQNIAKSELTTKMHILQSELNQAHLTHESQIKLLKSENERDLSKMYNR